jgi:serine protease Do
MYINWEVFQMKKFLSYFGVALLAAALTATLIIVFAPSILMKNNGQSSMASPVNYSKFEKFDNSSFGANSIAGARSKLAPAVVYINTVSVVGQNMDIPEQFRDFFPPGFLEGQQRVQTGAGSGFIIKKDGYILTNEHVVRNAQKLQVTLFTGKKYDGRVVGADAQTDLAVVKINANDLPTVEMGDSGKLIPGQWVVAIGNPYGFHDTVTAGIVSALGRSLENPDVHGDLIQTDAAINPGNSGGPLADLSGKVIGINEAIIQNAQGIGFAIPINLAKKISNDLIEKGKVQRPETAWLGVSIGDIPDQVASYYGLANKEGAIIQVMAESPAAKAGLQDGDIIKEINHQKIKNAQDVVKTIKANKVGSTVDILVLREGSLKAFKVKLEAQPQALNQPINRRQRQSPFFGGP